MRDVVLVTGDLGWTDSIVIGKALARHPAGTLLIQGGATGADDLAAKYGQGMGFFVATIPYAGHLGRAGGPARNGVMVEMAAALKSVGHPVYVYAFGEGKGTTHCAERAEHTGFVVERFT